MKLKLNLINNITICANWMIPLCDWPTVPMSIGMGIDIYIRTASPTRSTVDLHHNLTLICSPRECLVCKMVLSTTRGR